MLHLILIWVIILIFTNLNGKRKSQGSRFVPIKATLGQTGGLHVTYLYPFKYH